MMNDFSLDPFDPEVEVVALRGLDLWKLAEYLTIPQACLLLIGLDPQKFADIETLVDRDKPEGYVALREAITRAVENKAVIGVIASHTVFDEVFFTPPREIIDFDQSRVDIASLSIWLTRRGLQNHFFSSTNKASNARPYLDAEHPRYAPKLAAVVHAWLALEGNLTAKRSPKQQLERWLRENAARFGLSDDDGNPRNSVIEDLAKVANWQPGGGAPRSSDGSGSAEPEQIDPET